MNAKIPIILIVEDEHSIARVIQLTLEKEGFRTNVEMNGRQAYERILKEKYDLILLDIMLPEMTGMEICRKVRGVSDVPIIMLTACDEIYEKVEGLNLGADDYITKPFAPEELLARIQRALRRYNKKIQYAKENKYVVKDMIIYPDRYEVTVKGECVKLTMREYELLKYLVENRGQVLTRDRILQEVWGYDYIGDTNVVDVYISYLRTKIDNKYGENYIYTVRCVGYSIKD